MAGVEISEIYDGVLFWMCDSCCHSWQRFPEEDWRYAKAAEYVVEKGEVW